MHDHQHAEQRHLHRQQKSTPRTTARLRSGLRHLHQKRCSRLARPGTGHPAPHPPRRRSRRASPATATCTATESPVPAGYTVNQTSLRRNVDPTQPVGLRPPARLPARSPTTSIAPPSPSTRTSPTTTPASVTVAVTCTNGARSGQQTATGTASPAVPRDYTVTGFNLGATCTATETVPAGYSGRPGCSPRRHHHRWQPVARSPTPSTAPPSPSTRDFVRQQRQPRSRSPSPAPTAAAGAGQRPRSPARADAPFTITGFTLQAPTCTARDPSPAATLRHQAGLRGVADLRIGGTLPARSPTPSSARTFTVNKVYSPSNSTATVTGLRDLHQHGTPSPAEPPVRLPGDRPSRPPSPASRSRAPPARPRRPSRQATPRSGNLHQRRHQRSAVRPLARSPTTRRPPPSPSTRSTPTAPAARLRRPVSVTCSSAARLRRPPATPPGHRLLDHRHRLQRQRAPPARPPRPGPRRATSRLQTTAPASPSATVVRPAARSPTPRPAPPASPSTRSSPQQTGRQRHRSP